MVLTLKTVSSQKHVMEIRSGEYCVKLLRLGGF